MDTDCRSVFARTPSDYTYVAMAGMRATWSVLAQLRVHALSHKETISYCVHIAFLNMTQCAGHVKTSDQQFIPEQTYWRVEECGKELAVLL